MANKTLSAAIRKAGSTNARLFPLATTAGTLHKALGEIHELHEVDALAFDRVFELEELADVFCCLALYMKMKKITTRELAEAIDSKTEKNKKRKWQYNKQTRNYQHLKAC